MSEKEIIKDLLIELTRAINDCYFLYESHKKTNALESVEGKNNIIKYNEYKKVYDMLVKVKNIDEIGDVKSFVMNDISSIAKRHNELIGLHKKSTDPDERSKYRKETDRLAFKYNTLRELVQMINRSVSKYDVKKDTPVSVKKAPKIQYNDANVISIIAMLNEIKSAKIDLYRKGSSLEKRKRVFDLCSKREEIIESVLGFDGINMLEEIESIEDEAFSKSYISEKEYVIDSRGFRERFSKIIHDLNDVMFYQEDSEVFKGQSDLNYRDFVDYKVRQFKNITSSVGLNGNDILSRLSVCNLDGNYDKFKSKYKGDKIGSDEVSKVSYSDTLEQMTTTIEKMTRDGEKYIKENNGLVRVEDKGKRESDVLYELRDKYSELFNAMVTRKKEMTM